jgi:non-specific serine/threonine protein kinase
MIDPQGAETGPAYQTLGHIDALPAGTMLGEFEIQGLLGFGGFGMVYRGYDHSLQRAVAIKEYMPSALVARGVNQELSARSSADSQTFQSGLKSFIAEARLLARFDHPSLVKVYRFWEANNTAYMAMPLYQGITLKQARLQMSGPPPEDWLRVVLWSVLEALKVLHSSDALHRDVSPDNIFLQDSGPPVLLDLGAARLAVMEGNKKHTAVLKVNYAPIEQYADVSDLREGPWTDIYALAAVIHGCICNEPPLPATFRVVRDRLPAMAKIAKTTDTHFGQSYSSTFVKAIDYALAVQPGDRPQSVEAFAKALKLRSVSQPQRFDWRTALGDKVSLSADKAGAVSVAFGASATVADTVPFASAQGAASKAAPVAKDTGPVQPAKVARFKLWWWAVGGGILVLLALFLIVRQSRSTGKDDYAAPPPPSAVASAPASAASSAADIPLPQAVSASEPNVPALVPLTVQNEPVASPVARVQPRTPAPARAPAATKPSEDHRAGTGKSAVEAPPAAVTKQPDVQDPPRTAEAPKPKRDNHVLCADSNLFTRPMCIYQECQKPEFKNLQVCIEDRKRWEERDKQTRP